MKPPFDSVEVEVIAPERMRPAAPVGDWRIVNGMGEKKVLLISVADMGDWRSNHLVALHEYAEALMCLAKDVTQEMVDSFDAQYEASRRPGDFQEPGDSFRSPYWPQHSVATGIERIVAPVMGVNWNDHEQRADELIERRFLHKSPGN